MHNTLNPEKERTQQQRNSSTAACQEPESKSTAQFYLKWATKK